VPLFSIDDDDEDEDEDELPISTFEYRIVNLTAKIYYDYSVSSSLLDAFGLDLVNKHNGVDSLDCGRVGHDLNEVLNWYKGASTRY
jgi:hypothetical protein